MADAWSAKTPDRPRFVAGSIGPTNKTLSLSPNVNDPGFRSVTFDEVREAFAEQVRGLMDGGADLLLAETSIDTLNLKATLVAMEEVFAEKGRRLPVMLSTTITDKSGRTLSGQTIEAFYTSIEHARPLSVGVNCALGAAEMRPYVAALSDLATSFVSCYPNAGLPNAFGEYDETPRDHLRSGARVCCQRVPEHRRWLLRHHPRTHRRHRPGGGGTAAAPAEAGRPPHPAPVGSGTAGGHARVELHHDR